MRKTTTALAVRPDVSERDRDREREREGEREKA